jgi:hypothetical protein
MAHGYHAELTLLNIHVPYRFVYANAAARAAEAGAVAGDIGCLARQTDNNSLWILTATTPTWVSVADAGGSQVAQKGTIAIVISGGGAAIPVGIVEGDIVIPYNCTITSVTTLADQAAAAVVDIWVEHYADYPPTDADSITAAAPPTLAGTSSQDAVLNGWTVNLEEGQTLRMYVDSNDVATIITVNLAVTRT